MAICPFAVKKLIPAGSNDPRINARAAILHVDAGNATSLYEYFRDRSGGIESHFFIKLDGTIEQYRDTDYQADANYRANDFAVSIETQGFGGGKWTRKQLRSIKRLLLWLNKVENIPLRKIQKWDGSGVGYHTQFGAPGPWTPVAKSCPGPERIKQFNGNLVRWFRSNPANPPAPAPEPLPKAAMRVATANVKVGLGEQKSEACLKAMLKAEIDVLGLVEWGKKRRRILSRHAKSYRFPKLRRLAGFKHPTTGYVYVYPIGGGIPAVVDASVVEVISCRKVPSSGKHGSVGGRTATELILRRRSDGLTIPLRLVHLHAHHDDPDHKAAWREGVQSAAEWAESWAGFGPFVLGDMNSTIANVGDLVSCWKGHRRVTTGPHGGTIDHVYGPRQSFSVEAVPIPSDHPVGVIATY
jgi:hypothetical protein